MKSYKLSALALAAIMAAGAAQANTLSVVCSNEQAWCDLMAQNFKIDTGTVRVWLSRCGPEDGEDQPVQVEILRDGRWIDEDEEAPE